MQSFNGFLKAFLQITESLLAAFGYAKSEWKYNQNNAEGRPDFGAYP